jgi:hypothetical protein
MVQADSDASGVVKALAAYEIAVGDLYAAFSMHFAHETRFWHELSTQEYGHAEALTALAHDARDLATFIDTGRFNAGDVREATRRVREQVAVAEFSSTSRGEALRAAIELERSMVESRAFTVIADDSPSVRKTLEHLRYDSERHRQMLLDKLHAVGR